jgi:hypothetical protein
MEVVPVEHSLLSMAIPSVLRRILEVYQTSYSDHARALSAHAHDMARGVAGARRTSEGHMTLVAYGNVFPYPMMECALDQHYWLR